MPASKRYHLDRINKVFLTESDVFLFAMDDELPVLVDSRDWLFGVDNQLLMAPFLVVWFRQAGGGQKAERREVD